MRARLGFIFIYVWILALAALGTVTLLSSPKEERIDEEENRTMAGAPAFSLEGLLSSQFMSQTENWLSDSVAGREALISLSQKVDAALAMPKSQQELVQEEMAVLQQEMGVGGGAESIPSPEHPEKDEDSSKPPILETPAPTEESSVSSPSLPPEPTEAMTQLPPVNVSEVAATRFCFVCADGTEDLISQYTPEQLSHCADTLNIYRSLLDKDGKVFFALAPVANTANSLIAKKGRYLGWYSSMEEELRKHVAEGVIVSSPTEILNEPLLQGEYVYFRTDHHWTIQGACYTYRDMMRQVNVPPMEYYDYSYNSNRGFIGSLTKTRPRDSLLYLMDTTDVMLEEYPVTNYVLSELTKRKEVPFMNETQASYTSYIGGRQGPWRLFETGANTGRNAFVVGDSFAHVFVPYVLAHYDLVIMTDVRSAYYEGLGRAGASMREYLRYYEVDDIFIMLCRANDINTGFFTEDYLLRYLDA